MVKFSKQFEAQLVPEWKEAFVDYCKLKKDLKKFQPPNGSNLPAKNRRSSLSNTFLCSLKKLNLFSPGRRDHGAIQVHHFPTF